MSLLRILTCFVRVLCPGAHRSRPLTDGLNIVPKNLPNYPLRIRTARYGGVPISSTKSLPVANRMLMATEPASAGPASRALIEKWAALHAGRTALGFAAPRCAPVSLANDFTGRKI